MTKCPHCIGGRLMKIDPGEPPRCINCGYAEVRAPRRSERHEVERPRRRRPRREGMRL